MLSAELNCPEGAQRKWEDLNKEPERNEGVEVGWITFEDGTVQKVGLR